MRRPQLNVRTDRLGPFVLVVALSAARALSQVTTGDGGIVIADNVPVYSGSNSSKVVSQASRGQYVAGLKGSPFGSDYHLAVVNGRVQVLFFEGSCSPCGQRTGWIASEAISQFAYDCSCQKRCYPMENVSLLKSKWNPCFLAAAEAQVTGLHAAPISEPAPTAVPATSTGWQAAGGPADASQVKVNAAGHVFVGTQGGGLYRSTDGGNTWQAISGGLPSLKTSVIEVTPTGTLFAGAHESGIYRSENEGDAWSLVGQTTRKTQTTIFSTAEAVFVGDGFWCTGIYRSTNNGASWTQVNSGLERCVNGIAKDSAGHLFAATGTAGMYRSSNDGNTWVSANSGLKALNLHTVATNAAGWIFAGAHGGAGLYRSKDGGNSWTAADSGLGTTDVSAIAVDPSGLVLVGAEGNAGIFRSADGGDSWVGMNAGLPASSRGTVSSIAIDANGRSYAIVGGRVFRTTSPSVQSAKSSHPERPVTTEGRRESGEKPLTNSDVLSLVAAGMGEEVAIAKIEQAPAEAFDVSTEALIALKKRGVSQRVIQTMVKRVQKRSGTEAAGSPAQQVRPIPAPAPGGPGIVGDIWLLDDGRLAVHPLFQWNGGGCKAFSDLRSELWDDLGAEKRPAEWTAGGKPNPRGPRVSKVLAAFPWAAGAKVRLAAGHSEGARVPAEELPTSPVEPGMLSGRDGRVAVVAPLPTVRDPKLPQALAATMGINWLPSVQIEDAVSLEKLGRLAVASLSKRLPSLENGGEAPFAGTPVRVLGTPKVKGIRISSSVGELQVAEVKATLAAPQGGTAEAFLLLLARVGESSTLEWLWSTEGFWWEMPKREIAGGWLAPSIWGVLDLGPNAPAALLLKHGFTGEGVPTWELVTVGADGSVPVKKGEPHGGNCWGETGSGG